MDDNNFDNITINEEKGLIEVKGIVREILPNFTFRVELENGKFMLAQGSGRLRKKRIRISVMDKVAVEISKHGLELGRIAKRIDEKRENSPNTNNNQKKFKK
jgi:translation initiation factor IF-1